MIRSSEIVVSIALLASGCQSQLATQAVPDAQIESVIRANVGASVTAGVFYLGSDENLHHFYFARIPFGKEFFAIHRSSMPVPTEQRVGSGKPIECFDWFNRYIVERKATNADEDVVNKILSLPTRVTIDPYQTKNSKEKTGEPGATDNPDDAQRLREDH
jgi:hypothetical protein